MSKIIVPIDIVTCPEWGAKPAAAPPVLVPGSHRIILHHTAGHHREVSNPANESYEEAVRYARDIQHSHMSPSPTDSSKPWNDSGQNFLVCRNGVILQGRWYTVTAIEHGHMVRSAHCPGQNDQIGIEHEHAGQELMTTAQFHASARLMAWIAGQYGKRTPLEIKPHKAYINTDCPANLVLDIPRLHSLAVQILKGV